MADDYRSAETGQFVSEETAKANPATTVAETEKFDSSLDTIKHSRRVDQLLLQVLTDVQSRLTKHDASKLEDPEKAVFDEMTPKLRNLTYGSEEYKQSLSDMGAALTHHYVMNRHHPEHFTQGIAGMTLTDLIEMLADWKAATERHADGDLAKSLEIQRERFEIPDALFDILRNTAEEMGWL